MRRGWRTGAVAGLVVALTGCPIPAESTDGGPLDGASPTDAGRVDATGTRDAARVRDGAPAADGAVRGDAAAYRDASASPDRAAPGDAGTLPDAGAGPDAAAVADASPRPDAARRDAGSAPAVGEHCEQRPCDVGLICVGTPANAVCRQACVVGAGECDPQTEVCVRLSSVDGGVLGYGACLAGATAGQQCANYPCAPVYVCAYEDTPASATCHHYCHAGAGIPCPQNLACMTLNGMDGGACF